LAYIPNIPEIAFLVVKSISNRHDETIELEDGMLGKPKHEVKAKTAQNGKSSEFPMHVGSSNVKSCGGS